jgi:hypothetical protein
MRRLTATLLLDGYGVIFIGVVWGRPVACAGLSAPLVALKAAWEAAAGRGPAPHRSRRLVRGAL